MTLAPSLTSNSNSEVLTLPYFAGISTPWGFDVSPYVTRVPEVGPEPVEDLQSLEQNKLGLWMGGDHSIAAGLRFQSYVYPFADQRLTGNDRPIPAVVSRHLIVFRRVQSPRVKVIRVFRFVR